MISKKIIYTTIFLLCFVLTQAQTTINAIVKSSLSNEPLPYCNISVKSSSIGTITNFDGYFVLKTISSRDSVFISYLGYETLGGTAAEFANVNEIYLNPASYKLSEVTIVAEDEYLYFIVNECRKKLLNSNKNLSSKMYFALETKASGQAAEFVECYYNASFKGPHFIEMLLKNGRIALSSVDNRLFRNIETSKAIRRLNLTEHTSLFPALPLQFKKSALRENFNLFYGFTSDEIVCVYFNPKLPSAGLFSGEMWINTKTMNLLKIVLNSEHSEIHPFESITGDRIDNVSMNIVINFSTLYSATPELIVFNYDMDYHSGSGLNFNSFQQVPKIVAINCKTVIYCYDYNKPFLLPFFEYDTEISDYAKISVIPFNQKFWDNNNAMILTKNQKKTIGILDNTGYQWNFREGNVGKDFLLESRITENGDTLAYCGQYAFWKEGTRAMINKAMPQNKTFEEFDLNYLSMKSLCNFSVQILLDADIYNDSLFCRSYTVFDEANSYFHLPVEDYSNPFLNIYFDIYEVERRKMQQYLDSNNVSVAEVRKIYESASSEAESMSFKFVTETNYGENASKMKKWNQYVYDELNINNFVIFDKYYNDRQHLKDSLINSGKNPDFNIFE
jgi:hypothetical protein